MAHIIDEKNNNYSGETFVYDCIKNNLPEDMICYYNREILGREFDFCLFIEQVGIVVIEVKGWKAENIIRVESPDKIYTNIYEKPQKSPKKQARGYKYNIVNSIESRFKLNILVMDMVCYPFISEKDYKRKGLNIVSEPKYTLFSEDIVDTKKFVKKIGEMYSLERKPGYDKFSKNNMNKCRSLFEILDDNVEKKESNIYSDLRIYTNHFTIADVENVINEYFGGVKQIVFLDSCENAGILIENLIEKMDSEKIQVEGNNLSIIYKGNSELKNKTQLNIFNFEVYVCNNLSELTNSNIKIINGVTDDNNIDVLKKLGDETAFNFQQYEVEHAEINKNIVVKAGAGTGKTYSMISRIAYICNETSGANIVDIKNEIAMLTFTVDAAINMKSRLKQAFNNYFVLTKNPMYLDNIASIENMRISTIHSFARDIMKETSLALGIGGDFATISGNYNKQKIFDRNFNDFLIKKNMEEPLFFGAFPCSIYDFRKMLLVFADKLYGKGLNVSDASMDVFGKGLDDIPFFNEIISDVIIKTEVDYDQYLYENNSVNMNKYMIYLNRCISDDSFNTNLYKYKYIFIDEFQDVDDSQIESFLCMQSKIGFNFFIVGDLKQSIYRFRGATMDAFNKMGCDKDEWIEYSLVKNYRTDKRLLETYSLAFSNWGDRGLIPYNQNTDCLIGVNEYALSNDNLVNVYHYTNEEKKDGEFYEELYRIIKNRKEFLEEKNLENKLSGAEKTIAILVRANYQIDDIIQKMKDYEDIVVESDSSGDLYQTQSAIDLCKLTSALANPRNEVYLFDLLLSNNVNIKIPIEELLTKDKEEKLEYVIKWLDMFFEKVMKLKWDDLVYEVQNKPVLMVLHKIYDKTKPWKSYSYDNARQVQYRANYDLVFEELSSENINSYMTLESINESLHIMINTGTEKKSRVLYEDNDRVKIICTTVHKSKGLEYDTVILPFTNDEINVIKRNAFEVTYVDGKVGYCINMKNKMYYNEYFYKENEIEEIEMEETRILYVALTRAINQFYWFDKIDSTKEDWGKLLEVM